MIIKGMLMGIANIVPGVSGGTIAVMLKIYEKMIDHMDQFFKSPFKNKKTKPRARTVFA